MTTCPCPRADLESYLKDRQADAYAISTLYAWVGDSNQAIDYLEKAYAGRNGSMIFVAVAKEFEPLHNDVRFQALVQRMKLPQAG